MKVQKNAKNHKFSTQNLQKQKKAIRKTFFRMAFFQRNFVFCATKTQNLRKFAWNWEQFYRKLMLFFG